MITLSNGDKWIIGDKEWEEADITYEEAIKGNIPDTSVRGFIEELLDSEDYLLPAKLTDSMGGFWDPNFSVFKEVLGDVATRKISNNWSDVYEMPWGHIYVVYQQADNGWYDAETNLKRFKHFKDSQ